MKPHKNKPKTLTTNHIRLCWTKTIYVSVVLDECGVGLDMALAYSVCMCIPYVHVVSARI